MSPETRITELALELPPAPKPVAVYKPVVVTGNLAYVSGHGPLRSDKTLITGVVGRDLDLDSGKAAARQVGLAILATLREHFGSLDRVKRIIKVLGMCFAEPWVQIRRWGNQRHTCVRPDGQFGQGDA